MPRAKKKVKELTKIAEILTDIRNHEDSADALVEELEGIVAADKGTKHHKFCQAYVIVVIREFCSTDDDAELMLATYGLLKGFEFKPQKMTNRLIRYWKHSRNYNRLLENIKAETSVPKTASNKIENIIDGLDRKITARLSTNNGKLKLLDKVPDKLELPTPRNNKDELLFPDKTIDGDSEQAEGNMQPSHRPQQQPGDKLKPAITFTYSKLPEILIAIIVGALAVACILFAWMVIPKNNEDLIVGIPDTENTVSGLGNRSNNDENADNGGKIQDNESEDTDNRDEYQKFQDEMMSNFQNRIVNIDEPERYNIEMAYEAIIVYIINSPVGGDMVARGLRDLELYEMDQTLGDYAPWLDEFIEETDKAMALPLNQHPRGMERWLVYKKGFGNEASTSDEYFIYAASICNFLESTTILGVREWESVENWHLIREGVPNSSRRAERNPEQVTHQALVFQFTDTQGNVRALFGFSIYDLRFIVYDPEIAYE